MFLVNSHTICVLLTVIPATMWAGDCSEPPTELGTMFLEAEHGKRSGQGWSTVEFDSKGVSDRNSVPSGGKLLVGNNPTQGTVTYTIKNVLDGKYKVWFRYQDLVSTANPLDGRGFIFTLTQKDKPAQTRNIMTDTERSEVNANDAPDVELLAESAKKNAKLLFKWASCEATLVNGEMTCELKKISDREGCHPAPPIDFIYFTTKLEDKQPNLAQIIPLLFARIKVPADATAAVTVAGGGRSRDWKTRISLGRIGKKSINGKQSDPQPVSPNESSEWVNLSEQSKYCKDWMLYVFSPTAKKDASRVKYILQFATSPNEESVFKSVVAEGKSPEIKMWGSIADRQMVIDVDTAKWAAEKIAGLPPAKGKRPHKFPVGTAICVTECSENVIEQEMKNVADLGFNSFGLGSGDQLFFDYGPKFGYTFIDSQKFGGMGGPLAKCEFHGDPAKSLKPAEEYAARLKGNGAFDKVPFASLADEPGCDFTGHIVTCPECIDGFANFLKANGVTAQELGLQKLADAKPAHYPAGNDPLHYWSMRYFSYTMGGRFRTITQSMQNVGLRTGANFACQIVGNVMWNGANWFELFRNGDLTYGWTEDWFNLCRSYQFVGFQMSVMRAACKPAGTPYGTYCIIGNRTPWDVGAKSYSQFARKLDSFKVFNYGPNYGNSDAFNGREQDLLRAVRDVNFSIGAIEDSYLKAQPVDGDVAMLYSTTSDIWNMRWKNWFPSSLPGLERSTLYILLSQCGIRTDILHESDLKAELPNRKVLFATDSHIHADYLPSVIEWVRNGGTLYLGANALAFDHYNRPTGIEEKLGIHREKFELESVPGILEGSTPKPIGQVVFSGSKIPILFGVQEVGGETIAARDDGKHALTSVTCGKGTVILCGFFPGLSHFKRGSKNENVHFQSLSIYPNDTRALMNAVLEKTSVKPIIQSDNPMVEAHLLEAPDRDIVVLSSWTGAPCTVKVTIAGRLYSKAQPVRGELKGIDINGANTVLMLTVDSGDFIECFKQH